MKKLSLFLASALVAGALEIAVAGEKPTIIKPGFHSLAMATDTLPGKKNKKTPPINPTPTPTPTPTPAPAPDPSPTPTPTPNPNPNPAPNPPMPAPAPAPNPSPNPPKLN